MLSHKVSKQQEVADFAASHPLPETAEGLALGLLDIASILVACKYPESDHWDSMSIDIIYRHRAEEYPGAFLSNPALLLNTVGVTKHGNSLASHGAGCFFSYAHYQDDSLGPALLMGAFSPRTRKPELSARHYASALLLLKADGFIHHASVSLGDHGPTLESVADGSTPESSLNHVFFNMSFHRVHRAKLTHLRSDLSARAIELALSDFKPGLFLESTRERLSALVLERSATAEAHTLATHVLEPSIGRHIHASL